MKETILDGDTGFLVDSQEQMTQLIKDDAVRTINRDRCREWALQFSVERMVSRIEELCHEAIQGGWG